MRPLFLAMVGALAACSGGPATPADAGSDAGPDGGGCLHPPDGGVDGGAGTASAYCTVSGSTACDCGLSCLSFGSTGGFCSLACPSDGGVSPCPPGAVCQSLGSSSACVRPCATAADCPAGDVCAASSNGSLCLPDCRVHGDLCGPGTACNSSFGQCTAVGTVAFGQACSAASPCLAGLTCAVGTVGADAGWCTQPCSPTAPCPATPTGASCLQSNVGSLCGWTCTGPTDTTCPVTLTCQASGTAYLCQ